MWGKKDKKIELGTGYISYIDGEQTGVVPYKTANEARNCAIAWLELHGMKGRRYEVTVEDVKARKQVVRCFATYTVDAKGKGSVKVLGLA